MSDNSVPTLSVDHLSVFIDKKPIVCDISLNISVGQWTCIIGPNGAGKSTLLKALAGILKSEGSISVDGNDLRSFSEKDRACWIGYVAQDPVFPRGMRVFDYVMLGRTAHLNLLASETPLDTSMTESVLRDLDLMEFSHRDVATLSGGERQRVAIARALAQASPFVLLDEPTTALDVGHQQEVLELIDRLRAEHKIAVISTMHDLTVSGMYTDHLVLMNHGKSSVSGTPHEVLTPEHIKIHYKVDVDIIDNAGFPMVLPRRTLQ